ncbi:hypothetical protein LSPCS325_00790 [Lysinibacillus sp. CTST325]
MKKTKEVVGITNTYDYEHPELKKEECYTSPASPLPLYELKLLQEFIHGVNIQNLGEHLPHFKKQMMLMKFFKFKKNQLVEVYSKNGDQNIHTVGKVHTIGRNFVMLKTLFTRIWIPYITIHSAKSPFGIPAIHNTHQNVVIDEELRKKLLTNFSHTVSNKQVLRQQFFEELLETNLKTWKGTKLTIYATTSIKGKILNITPGKVYLKHHDVPEIPTAHITYIKQGRVTSFFQRLFSNWLGHNKTSKKSFGQWKSL